MKPSPGLSRADLMLRFPAYQAGRVAKVREGGGCIKFIGKIAYLGTRLRNHIVEIEQFAPPEKGRVRPSSCILQDGSAACWRLFYH
jgi:hypothetical protein